MWTLSCTMATVNREARHMEKTDESIPGWCKPKSRFWPVAWFGLATFIVSLLFFAVLFTVLIGNTWEAGVAKYTAAILCTAFEVWRTTRKRDPSRIPRQRSEVEQ